MIALFVGRASAGGGCLAGVSPGLEPRGDLGAAAEEACASARGDTGAADAGAGAEADVADVDAAAAVALPTGRWRRGAGAGPGEAIPTVGEVDSGEAGEGEGEEETEMLREEAIAGVGLESLR